MRKLASIRKITKLLPINGKDFIVLAVIDGWTVIVKKDEFQEGDLCVFFEIDSFLPNEDRYSFLKETTYKGQIGHRIKTMKMAGVISQGLALPLSILSINKDWCESEQFFEGDDITEILSIVKYDVAEVVDNNSAGGLKTGNPQGKFPSFIPKTDQDRIQNCMAYFDIYKDHEFEETLKLDGSSMTCYKVHRSPTLLDRIKAWFGVKSKSYHFGVCSRNLEIKPNDSYSRTFDSNGKSSEYKQSDFWKAAIKYKIEEKLPIGYAVQGELIGPKIQANHEKVHDLEYHIFDIYDIVNEQYLLPRQRNEFIHQYQLNHVPIIDILPILKHHTLEQLLERVEGQSINQGTISEGRVYKSTTIPGLSFKIISNKYLLKCEQ